MPLITEEYPPEGGEVRIWGIGWVGEKRGYWTDDETPGVPVWYESADGEDILLVGVVVSWEYVT